MFGETKGAMDVAPNSLSQKQWCKQNDAKYLDTCDHNQPFNKNTRSNKSNKNIVDLQWFYVQPNFQGHELHEGPNGRRSPRSLRSPRSQLAPVAMCRWMCPSIEIGETSFDDSSIACKSYPNISWNLYTAEET